MLKYALVFSGQGSENVGMFNDFFKEPTELNELVNVVNSRTGLDLNDIILSKDKTVIAANNQLLLCIFHHLMSTIVVKKIGYPPDICMGHSFGQFSALVASGSVKLEDMAKLIFERTRIINSPDIKVQAIFKSIHGMKISEFEEMKKNEKLEDTVVLALHNQEEQVVVAVTADGDEKLKEILPKYKFIIKELNVSRPYHTSFMTEYNELLLPYVREINFLKPKCPVIVNSTAELTADEHVLSEEVKIQMIKPVYWYDSVKKVSEIVDVIIVIDPGDTQLKIISRISDKKIYNVCNLGTVRIIERQGLRNV